mgnify:CR=1 FL=1
MIDRLDERRAIGAATKRIQEAERGYFESIKGRRDALHKKWRVALEHADAVRKELDQMSAGWRCVADPADIAVIDAAKVKYSDLLVYRDAPGEPPKLCAATGLALFEGDAVYGDSEYGGAILKAAVGLLVDPVADPVGSIKDVRP